MDLKTFEIIQDYERKINNLYMDLEKNGVGVDKLEELFEPLEDHYKMMISQDENGDEFPRVDEMMYLTEQFRELPKYHKLNAIYDYRNGYYFCETTTELHYLVPQEILATLDE